MGLLTQALAGGLSSAAGTMSNLMIENDKAQRQSAYQSERDKATALREQNLAAVRQQNALELQKQSQDHSDSSAETQRQYETEKADVDYERKTTDKENNLSTEYLVNGKPATIGEVKAALKTDPDAVKLREDTTHERTRTEKETDRGKELEDYKKKKKIDTDEDIRKEKAKPASAKETDAVRSGPNMRYVKADNVKRNDGTTGPGTMAFDMTNADHRAMFSRWVSSGKGVEVHSTESTSKEDPVTGEVTNTSKTKSSPAGGLISSKSSTKAAPAKTTNAFVYKDGKLQPK